jgi:hypothetical protein
MNSYTVLAFAIYVNIFYCLFERMIDYNYMFIGCMQSCRFCDTCLGITV